MKYVNTKTGTVQDFKCRVSGGDWQEVKPSAPPATPAEKKPARQPKKKDEQK